MIYKRTVNYYETDRMSFVHHSNYIRYFEEARVWILEQFGLPYADIEKRGILIPVLGVNVKYMRYLTFGDNIDIDTRITKFSGVKMSVGYEVSKNGETAAKGESSHCFLEAGTFRPVNLKTEHPDIYEAFSLMAEKTKK